MSSPERAADSPAAPAQPLAPASFSSWQAVADFLRAAWGEPDASAELGAVAERIAATEATPAGRIAGALAFVRRDIRAVEKTPALDQPPTSPGAVLGAAAGDALARAGLLWHLLRRIGLPARPVFTGPALDDATPALAAFDRVLVEVGGRCHSVDAPDAARDRALADAPLGLTLAPGIVDLEPIAPWQPAPAEKAAAPQPPPAAPRPVQVEFVLDFASPATARAAEVEAALVGPAPMAPVKAAPMPVVPPVVESKAEEKPAPAEVEEVKVEAAPAPTPIVEAKAEPPRRTLRDELLERARLHRQASAPPAPPPPSVAPLPAPEPEPASPSPEPVAEPIAPAPAAEPMPPVVESPAPAPVARPTPRTPTARPSLREELQARAEHRPARAPRQNPPSLTRPNPRPRSDDEVRTDYDFDPTVRARRSDRAAQFKIALMVLGILAVIALWVFVFLAKRAAP